MSQWFGLVYPLKPGSEPEVEQVFRQSGRPQHDVRGDDGSVKGQLLRTVVFMGKGFSVRIIEFEGDLTEVSSHMSRQKEVQEFEREIEKYLAVPRDMVSPEGARKFFRESGLRCILNRHRDD